MTYRVEFPDIVYSIVQRMNVSMTITDYAQSGTTHTIEVCDVKWLQAGYPLTIGGNSYTVVSVDDATNIVVLTGDEPITVSAFDIYRPKFFYGTPIDTENQLKPKRLSRDKYPMIYLMLNYSEQNDDTADSAIERTVEARIYALSDSNFEKWETSGIHEYAMKPMARLMQIFIQTMNVMKRDFYMEEFLYRSVPRYKFGVFIDNKGAVKSFFTNNLSGWEMSINDLQIRKYHTCVACAPLEFPEGIGAMIVEETFEIG